jgi:hypothetical protein
MAECLEIESVLTEIPVSEILAKIEKSEKIVDAIIKCDLNPIVLNLPKIDGNGKFLIASKIKLINCRIYGKVNFSDTIFQEEASFNETQFNNYVGFNNSEFRDKAYFISTLFCNPAGFNGTKFNMGAIFSHARFCGPAYFSGGGEFDGVADFSYSHFNRLAFFHEVKFKRDAAFNWAQFRKGAQFVFPDFKGEANFSESEFNEKATFKDNTFHSLILENSDFKRLEIPWADIKDGLEYHGATYLSLVKNYNNLEWFDDADECYWQYRTKRRKEHLTRSKRIIDLIPWWFYGYGVRFYYPLIWMLVILIISAIIYVLGGQAQFPGAFGLSTIILTTTTQTGDLTGSCWIISILERIMGWLLMACFLVVLAKKTLR